jgi:hypothetical protein
VNGIRRNKKQKGEEATVVATSVFEKEKKRFSAETGRAE